MEEIICKWWCDTLNIGVTQDLKVYTIINGNPVELKKEIHMNRPHYRIPKTSKRFSDLTINKSVSDSNKIIQQYCPF